MTVSLALVWSAAALGFLLLLITVGAFVVGRERVGVGLLVVAAAVFITSLVLMGRLSTQEQSEARQAVAQKYRVRIDEWGPPLGVAPTWEVDGRKADCAVNLDNPDDPVVTCDGKELPRR